MLATGSLVPLPLLNPAFTPESSQFTHSEAYFLEEMEGNLQFYPVTHNDGTGSGICWNQMCVCILKVCNVCM